MAEIKFPTIRIDEADMYRLEQIVNKLDAEIRRISVPCTWTFTTSYHKFSEDYWETSCGQAFCMITGTPKENNYNFCPSCGKPLVEFYIQDSEDDEEELEDDCEDDPRRNGAIKPQEAR